MGPSKRWNQRHTAPAVGGIFFPQREKLGLDARELTPRLVGKIVHACGDARSEKRAQISLEKVGDVKVSLKTIERVSHDVGAELKALRDDAPSRLPKSLVPPPPAAPPKLAVVMVDGGRMMTRQPGHGPGVHEQAWRETKNASFESMTHRTFDVDPQPGLPACFQEPKHVAEIVGTAALNVPTPDVARKKAIRDDDALPRPKRLLRTCLSSLVNSSLFGVQMNREARRRCFPKAAAKAFLGDGLAWNWTLWKIHFPTFEPILDFMHAIEYVYAAAVVMHTGKDAAAWACYMTWAQQCWSGEVAKVIPELLAWLQSKGIDPNATLDDKHAGKAVHDAHRYLTNNISRMDYSRYRTAGLPVTSAPMESLVKQVNLRVKGTEMFWNDAEKGGESILQIRAAVLSEDGRLDTFLENRPGSPFVRKSSALAYKTLKS